MQGADALDRRLVLSQLEPGTMNEAIHRSAHAPMVRPLTRVRLGSMMDAQATLIRDASTASILFIVDPPAGSITPRGPAADERPARHST